MERPGHLNTQQQSGSSRLIGAVAAIGIQVAVVGGLITALATGAIIKQMQEIKASVEREKVPPKPPPPPPVDFKAPPPVAAIVPEFNVTQAPPPAAPRPTPAPPPAPPRAAPAPPPAPTQLVAITRTHTKPAYPVISQRLGEHGTTGVIVSISTEGEVTDCKVEKSSGFQRLDSATCDWVKSHWRWKPPTREGKAVTTSTRISMVWDLKDAQ
jgi:protein TonB